MPFAFDDLRLDQETHEWMAKLRRWFHRNPELSFREHNTQKKITDTLTALGIEHRRAADTGVIGTVYGSDKGRTVALRADMDALQIQEADTSLNKEYVSQNKGVMHACGHDAHMAMVLGAAKWLQAHRDRLKGNVRLLFQPAEEKLPGGAKGIINDGGLTDVDAILGVHVLGGAEPGRVMFRPGPYLAQPCDYHLQITGQGGHHLKPQDCVDPIMVASRFVASIKQDIAASIDPTDTYVLGFGTINGGTQYNQTPEQLRLSGSFRVFDEKVAEMVERAMRRNLDGLMKTFAKVDIESVPRYDLKINLGYPVLVNDKQFSVRAAETLKRVLPKVDAEDRMNLGGEDFAYYLQKVPGLFAFLGAANQDKGIVHFNHSNRFDIDEDVLGVGVRVFLTLAVDFLGNPEPYLR